MYQLIDGKKISVEIKEEVKAKVAQYKENGVEITLAVIQVGNDPASSVYVGNKKKACEFVGIRSLSYELPEETTEAQLLDLVEELNHREDVNGILVQLPLPKQIDEEKVLNAISPLKDVDGFHPMNVGALCIGKAGFVSCTPAGIIELLKRSVVEIKGKKQKVVYYKTTDFQNIKTVISEGNEVKYTLINSEMTEDKEAAYATLWTVLVTLSKILSFGLNNN